MHLETNLKGFILINKPAGMSSFQAVKKVRSLTGVKKVGHAGTLDPFATGLLIIALGREFTRKIEDYRSLDKHYEGLVTLGEQTDTLDPEGHITVTHPVPEISEEKLLEVSQQFLGEQLQKAPRFSAKKINGKRAYALARKGEEFEQKEHPIIIHSLTLALLSPTTIKISVRCSKGTYIRQLAADLAAKLSTVGYLSELKRTHIGDYSLDNALLVEDLTLQAISTRLFTHEYCA